MCVRLIKSAALAAWSPYCAAAANLSRSYQDSRVTISFDGDSGYPFGDGDVLTMRIGGPDLMLIETGEGFFGSVNRKLMQPLR